MLAKDVATSHTANPIVTSKVGPASLTPAAANTPALAPASLQTVAEEG